MIGRVVLVFEYGRVGGESVPWDWIMRKEDGSYARGWWVRSKHGGRPMMKMRPVSVALGRACEALERARRAAFYGDRRHHLYWFRNSVREAIRLRTCPGGGACHVRRLTRPRTSRGWNTWLGFWFHLSVGRASIDGWPESSVEPMPRACPWPQGRARQ